MLILCVPSDATIVIVQSWPCLQPHCMRYGNAALHGSQPVPQVSYHHQVLPKSNQVQHAHGRLSCVHACPMWDELFVAG